MNNATVIPTQFDQEILDTIEHCTMKISRKLKEVFDPDKAESKSLFRLFCSAVNTRARMLQKMTNAIQKANQAMTNIKKTGTTTLNSQSTTTQNALQDQDATLDQDAPLDQSNYALITEKKKKKSRAGGFWRNKKLA